MATLLAKTQLLGNENKSRFEEIRAEALFASTLQATDTPAPGQVRLTVITTLRRLGIDGCAAQLAAEFGDHPDLATTRMAWALATVRTAYPTPSTAAARTPTTDGRQLITR